MYQTMYTKNVAALGTHHFLQGIIVCAPVPTTSEYTHTHTLTEPSLLSSMYTSDNHDLAPYEKPCLNFWIPEYFFIYIHMWQPCDVLVLIYSYRDAHTEADV